MGLHCSILIGNLLYRTKKNIILLQCSVLDRQAIKSSEHLRENRTIFGVLESMNCHLNC